MSDIARRLEVYWRNVMCDYDWYCPNCGERMHWNDDGLYSEAFDDTVCSECGVAELKGEVSERLRENPPAMS